MSGRARVIDGDTILMKGVDKPVRLYGIDAPERHQRCTGRSGHTYGCGEAAAAYLARLIGRHSDVRCTQLGVDRYGRPVAECLRGDGINLNRAMVAAGWAIDYRPFSDGRYAAAQTAARAARKGIWRGSFTAPSKWRRQNR